MKSTPPWSKIVVALVATSALLLTALPARVQAVNPQHVQYVDGEFKLDNWDVDVKYSGIGQELERIREMLGGKPKAFLGAKFDLPIARGRAAPPQITATHEYRGGIYDAAFMGAIGGIAVTVDRKELADNLDGVDVTHAFVLLQDGEIFTVDLGTCCSADWTLETTATHCLHPEDFDNVNHKQPDFSESGGPIFFGLQTTVTNNSTEGPRSVAVGYDNFNVVVALPANPTCAVLPPNLRLDMSAGSHLWGDDPVIPFEITITNEGAPAADLELTTVVPVHTTFSPADSTPGWTCSGDGSEGATCVLPVPAVDGPGGQESFVFAARVDEGTDVSIDIYADTVLGEAANPRGSEVYDITVADCVWGWMACFDNWWDCCYYMTVVGPICREMFSWGPRAVPQLPERALLDAFVAYRMRDNVFANTRGGRRAVELFYQFNDDLLQAAADQPDLLELARTALLEWEPYLRALADRDAVYPADAYPVFPQVRAALEAYLDAMRPVASPALAEAMDRERAALDLANWGGMTPNQILARLHRLSRPGYEGVLPCGALNDDCKVTATDALLALKMAVKSLPTDPAADHDGNGSVTATDALGILRVGVKLDPPSFACGV